MSTMSLPATFPIVGLPLFATFALNASPSYRHAAYQSMSVMSARTAAGVKYPTLYASEADAAADAKKMKFNCAQRAHANTLESAPYVLALFGFLSIFHPKIASIAQLLWVVGRVGYTRGYATGEPAKRINGLTKISYLGMAILLFGTLGVSAQKTYALFF
ncbi:glutathione S-transferase [Cryptococcus wingfieldii CBS 7118]|uniref:Glutathione S-transferase n=1 Tax=Cryptococcus wingfieldii CBS 7118 TaxID=1295528 RepID=A0A1E3JMC2_9TREE|nr:glutathione S-transferase [Cryptococcus wingfieldii CBS 7118]ODO01963.1 glutathione S-transferase [Cryptococcus wingfieldii CBS 7118]